MAFRTLHPGKVLWSLGLVALAATVVAFGPETEAHGLSQSAADVLREAAGAEAGFLPAGMVRQGAQADDLATLVRYPTDELSVVRLRGSQIRAALERSVSLFPSPSDSFLQLSNIEAVFTRSGAPDNRIVSVSLGGVKLDDSRVYTVSMPSTLARGGLGYFKIWDRTAIKSTLEGVTLESLLKGKRSTVTEPRWKSVP